MDTTRPRRRSTSLAALLPGLTVLAVLATTAPGGGTDPLVPFTMTQGGTGGAQGGTGASQGGTELGRPAPGR